MVTQLFTALSVPGRSQGEMRTHWCASLHLQSRLQPEVTNLSKIGHGCASSSSEIPYGLAGSRCCMHLSGLSEALEACCGSLTHSSSVPRMLPLLPWALGWFFRNSQQCVCSLQNTPQQCAGVLRFPGLYAMVKARRIARSEGSNKCCCWAAKGASQI